MDNGLSVMDGYELAERLRAERSPRLRLIAATGRPARRLQRSRAAGFDEHVVKSIDLDLLDRALHGQRTSKGDGARPEAGSPSVSTRP